MTTINGSLSERDVRIAKVQQLRDLGINPYVQKFEKSDDIASLLHKNTQNLRNIEDIIKDPYSRYSIAGRLTLYRSHGKLSFGRLMDESGEIQIMRHSDNCHINI